MNEAKPKLEAHEKIVFTTYELIELVNYLNRKIWSEEATGWGSPEDIARLKRIELFLKVAAAKVHTGQWY